MTDLSASEPRPPETILSSDDDERVLNAMIKMALKTPATDYVENTVMGDAFHTLLEQFARFATGDDYLWAHPDLLLARATSAWEAGNKRRAGQSIINLTCSQNDLPENTKANGVSTRTYPGKRLALRIITDDKPFLVDSITAALADAGKATHFFVNAIIDIPRNDEGHRTNDAKPSREAIIYAELDPPIDSEEVQLITQDLEQVLRDVEAAVSDWNAMRMRLDEAIVRLRHTALTTIPAEDITEITNFLSWVLNDHFAFLGVRRYRVAHEGDKLIFERDSGYDLGILKDSTRRILKNTYSPEGDLSPAVEAFIRSDEPLLLAKANSKSLVHRRAYQDYIGIKLYNEQGEVIGEDRFVGLYTNDAYNRPASDIPYLRAKVQKILDHAPFVTGGHNEKALLNILETYPRDELFQVDVDTLHDACTQILRLYKRPRVKLIMRRDRFDRFISAFVFIPRDDFNSDKREAIGDLLANTFNGRVSAFYPFFGDASLVRVHFIIGLDPHAPEGPGITELTRSIRAICRDWDNDLLDGMRLANDGVIPSGLYTKYHGAFEAGYREHMSPDEALIDINVIEAMGDKQTDVRVYRLPDDPDTCLRIKLYNREAPFRLSRLIPTLENFGLSVITENGYEVNLDTGPVWIQDFKTEDAQCDIIRCDEIKTTLEIAMLAILQGHCEDDGFNQLVLAAGLSWREAWLLRTVAKHHLQTGFQYSKDYMEETLGRYPVITRALIDAFDAKFDPDFPGDTAASDPSANNPSERLAAYSTIVETIHTHLEAVQSLDEDRIIRRFIDLFNAVTRTNFYQTKENTEIPCVVLKIDSAKLDDIPEPKPYREIFVSGPAIDGVHLRFGPVARGGLRWSDRKEDFRTEILGLVKAQRVKNAVIVPTGSKGGFYPKQLPVTDDRSIVYEAGRDAYKLFIRSLLSITDNIVNGATVTPPRVIPHEAPDPYLVVAADKGTAQFSDTANSISEEYNFWLGDAFASGGSVGYDHKAMGITARGAWEAVKRHFREMDKDIQNDPFTVAGVGDMSGDVFGNGMLLSEKIRLIAAFDHRDIFIDPDPDPALSFAERKRLFNLPRSSWASYDTALISKGGGVFSRTSKSISLSAEMQSILNVTAEQLPPNELIRAILKAPVELFWLGGIGTYFKAASESNLQVGDRANDAIRINADEMGAKVIGEGANLGLTQKARIEFAQLGGHINTDAIDNSAGVDSSDHEVNIKILLRSAIESQELDATDRDTLLAKMTDDVAKLVLQHNYDQTRAMSLAEIHAGEELEAQSRFLSYLEDQGRLDRQVEELPSREAIQTLLNEGRGLTRPELAVLLAYAKLWLFDEITNSAVPDDPALTRELIAYFPPDLHGFEKALSTHRLRREIIATRLCNEIVDTCGLCFVYEAMQVTGACAEEIVLCYEASRRIFDLRQFADTLNNLDNKISAMPQLDLYREAATLLTEQTYRLVTDIQVLDILQKDGLDGLVNHYKDPIAGLRAAFMTIAPPAAADAINERYDGWHGHGVPEAVAKEAALFQALERAIDIVDIARETGTDTQLAGALFFAMGQRLSINILRQTVRKYPLHDSFDKRALRRLMEEATRHQKSLTLTMMRADPITIGPENDPTNPDHSITRLDEWAHTHKNALQRFDRFIGEIDIESQEVSVSKISLLNRQLSELQERIKA